MVAAQSEKSVTRERTAVPAVLRLVLGGTRLDVGPRNRRASLARPALRLGAVQAAGRLRRARRPLRPVHAVRRPLRHLPLLHFPLGRDRPVRPAQQHFRPRPAALRPRLAARF